MDKLILIDGNSLLNRAFYAMRVFSTKDGLPTNGIFGFIKFLFRIISEEKPQYFVVAFDLPAPTFRHKMYDGYKATRKPMPDELAKQVPVLKDLLKDMNICVLEKKGYEADDIIGTLSRKFEDVEVSIYTGDRDSYQLVRKGVSICFTKHGVTGLDRLTAENFQEKIGLEPWQIVEEKALMGDSSDNIPGVKGIGGKTALELLQKYRDLDGVYAHLDELSPVLIQKMKNGAEMARLSHTLAKIDTEVPLDVTLNDCVLRVPFPEKARAAFLRLEFRSLIDGGRFEEPRKTSVNVEKVTDLTVFQTLLDTVNVFSVSTQKEGWRVCFGDKEYAFPLKENILGEGYFESDLIPVLRKLFSGKRKAITSDMKGLMHRLNVLNVPFACEAEDVTLMRYLGNSNNLTADEKEYASEFGLSADCAAYSLFVAYEDAKKRLGEKEEKLYRDIELPLAPVLYEMECTGVRVDETRFPEFSKKFNAELEVLSAQIFAEAGGEKFNLNSPFQLSRILFEKLGYEAKGIKKNIRGGYSTSAEVLEKLAEDHEIARLVLRYRGIQKLQSTYIDGIRPLVRGGIVHPTYNQTATTTGRLSCANPNLQNIPVRTDEGRELRKLFIAREGNIFIDADYSQIELRLLAHCSGSKALREAYRKGEDIHASTASRIFGVPIGEVTPAMRRRAKTVNFGIIYGMGRYGLAKDIGCSAQDAQDYLDKYFKTYPEVKDFMEESVRFAKEHGFITTILGRKRYIPELRDSNHNVRAFGERAAMNMPLLGSAAVIIQIAMLKVASRLKKEGLNTRMVLQVHDELVLDAPLEEQERATALLKEEMESAFELTVPLVAEASCGRSWYEAK